jgi:hypothetical protein
VSGRDVGRQGVSHLNKKPEAWVYARRAAILLEQANELLEQAETSARASGYHRAATGIHQANLRVASWREKIYREVVG